MVVGESLMIGKNAQFLVEGLIAKDIVNVTTQFQKMGATIVPPMAQRISKQRDVMKIHAQVSTISNTYISISDCSPDFYSFT